MQVQLLLSREGTERSPISLPEFPVPIQLGCVVGTEAAIGLLNEWGIDLNQILSSHRVWNLTVGDVVPKARSGAASGRSGNSRLLSALEIGDSDCCVWLLTDVDRDMTLLLLPDEYRGYNRNDCD